LILSKTSSQGSALPWPNIIAFGVDAVTVPRAAAVVEPDPYLAELAGKPHTLRHKRVLTTSGVQLGTVLDVDFDPAIGRLAAAATRAGTDRRCPAAGRRVLRGDGAGLTGTRHRGAPGPCVAVAARRYAAPVRYVGSRHRGLPGVRACPTVPG
jgi:hypothetical protein